MERKEDQRKEGKASYELMADRKGSKYTQRRIEEGKKK
jgi:hypothetical protein